MAQPMLPVAVQPAQQPQLAVWQQRGPTTGFPLPAAGLATPRSVASPRLSSTATPTSTGFYVANPGSLKVPMPFMSATSTTASAYSGPTVSPTVSFSQRSVAEEASSGLVRRKQLKAFLETNGFFNVNMMRNSWGRQIYPIHVAAKQNDADMVRLLLELGADPAKTTTSGKTAEDIAEQKGFDDIVELLRAWPSQQGRQRFVSH